jgi:4-deoxy-L-threo-5-hexosulose-uronate ketol-isomerase
MCTHAGWKPIFILKFPKTRRFAILWANPTETRPIWMKNHEAVLSPSWSIHAAAGTSNYIFIWGMAGENLDYGDMDMASINEIR